ncbi:MAG: hypothetical protein JXR76_30730, partial [Deltaproteobacteria bacterium]|nr:hypothetical protein [Deltaproteobacteria bacterium]
MKISFTILSAVVLLALGCADISSLLDDTDEGDTLTDTGSDASTDIVTDSTPDDTAPQDTAPQDTAPQDTAP